MAAGRTGPTDPQQRQEWRRARRSVLLAHHPDRGGDPDRMRAELERVDREFTTPAAGPVPGSPGVDVRPPGPLQPLARGVRSATGVLRRGTRAARARLPSGWPGHRRYIDL